MDDSVNRLTISEMSNRYGVTLRTLRFYEDRGFLQPVLKGTARFYEPKDRIRLELILKGKRLGFSLEEIWRLIRSVSTSPDREPAEIMPRLDRARIAAQIDSLSRQRDGIHDAIIELQASLDRGAEPQRLKVLS